MAAQVSAQISARAAASAETTLPPVRAQPSFLSRVPRRAVWSALAGVVGASIAFYMLALRLLDDEVKSALTSSVRIKAGATKSGAPAPVPGAAQASAASAALAKALEGEAVSVTQDAASVSIALRHERQFQVGSVRPTGELRPLLEKIAAALDGIPGAITVTGHADTTPAGKRHASNLELSSARARAAAQIMSPKLSAPARLTAEGKGDAEPVASGNTAADRARNRRLTISIRPGA
jgi:type VI secretion system protein ImpK